MGLGITGQLKTIRDYMGESRVDDGMVFTAGTGLISSSDHVRATLANPSASGVKLLLVRLIISHDQSGILPAQFFHDPDTNLPSTTFTSLNNLLSGSNTSQATLSVDAGVAMSGGTPGTQLPVAGSTPANFPLHHPMSVPQGSTLGMHMDVASALTSGSVTVMLAWIEQTV